MITNDILEQVQNLPFYPQLLSYSLFTSDKVNMTRHTEPYLNWRDKNPDVPTIGFLTEPFAAFIGERFTHVIEVPQLPHYNNHFYRYCAVASSSPTVICLGTDEPYPHQDFLRCLEIAKTFDFDVVCAFMENHPHNLIGGRIAFMSIRAKEHFLACLKFVRPSKSWNCDQDFLTNVIRANPFKAVINAPAGVFKKSTLYWLETRLNTCGTIIVREPNRYD
jgi:hypothetical protein